jgi:hypothetical protein
LGNSRRPPLQFSLVAAAVSLAAVSLAAVSSAKGHRRTRTVFSTVEAEDSLVPVDTSHPTDRASKEFRAIIPKAAATDYIRGLLLKDHDLLYKRLRSVKLMYSQGNAAGNFLEANRATGKDKEDLLAIAAAAKGGHGSTTPRAGPKTRRPPAKSNIICRKCNKVCYKAAVCRSGRGPAK